MQHQITIREAVADADIARFWEQLYRYYARDIFTEAGSGGREHFIGPEYYEHVMKIRSRPQGRARIFCFLSGTGRRPASPCRSSSRRRTENAF